MSKKIAPHTTHRVTPGRFHPLGATPCDAGVNFALFSQHAHAVWLELYDEPHAAPTDVIPLTHRTRYIWHGLVHGLKAGQLYGYRVDGEYDPPRGERFNPNKLLLDPYAKAISHRFVNEDNLLLGYDPSSPAHDLTMDTRDNGLIAPKAIVIDDTFDWEDDASPEIPLDKLIIYEVHVKGFTRDPSAKVAFPGTYLGFIEKIPYLQELGINAVELLPVHESVVEDFLVARGLTNYWGYNTIGFFAPESSYGTGRSPGCQVREFKQMVRALHKAGIDVILDVVYNHSAEGNERGPTLSFKGIDNPSYYVLTGSPNEPARYYANFTGCGNSLNLANPHVIRFVVDSLRYWVETMHVDGFRFDLASVLGRQIHGFERSSSFFAVVSQDPVLSRIKLIAEPWDLGTYQVGNFPVDWSEWNGRFRDTLRRFVKGDPGQIPHLGWRLTGSADLYKDDGRSAFNSINFITCHDGFTLYDLVSYDRKHNEANQENNQDGNNDNDSCNCGVEGPTDDPEILSLRRRMVKNNCCHLLFSLGTPMLLGGDEFLRSQRGNNNAYCQDNEISWFCWDDVERNADMVRFFQKAIAFNKRYTILHRRKFMSGRDNNGNLVPDIQWFGLDLDAPGWGDPECRVVGYMLDGSEEPSELGEYYLFLLLNSNPSTRYMKIPPVREGMSWYRVVDTSLPAGEDFCVSGEEVRLDPADHYLINGRSTVVLLAR